jgi:hypothetical protein
MSGILFLNTQDLSGIRKFYQKEIGLSLWLDQGGCVILKHGNFLLGFCQGTQEPFHGMITFFYESKMEVDQIYHRLIEQSEEAPRVNEKFQIYHFFAKDPEGRRLEFQQFLHPLDPYLSGEELLLHTKPVQKFQEEEVPDVLLRKLFALCRYPSTTSDSPTYTYSVVREERKRFSLINLLGKDEEPYTSAPLILIISAGRKVEPEWMKDVYSSAYHFSLAAKLHGLATTWVADLDQAGIRKLLQLPKDENPFLAMFVGYPMKSIGPSKTESKTGRIRFVE